MGANMQRLDEVYSFCVARAEENAADADESSHEQQTVRFLRDLRAAIQADATNAGVGLDVFLLYAARDRGHPDYKPEWDVEYSRLLASDGLG
jgi:hypothetical protein